MATNPIGCPLCADERAARERAEKERDAARAEMHDWYCVGCAQRYDAPPDEGTSRRSCPKCGKWMLFFVEHQREKLAARAAAAEAKAAQYERDWYAAKSEFGEAMAKLRDRADAAESALAQARRAALEEARDICRRVAREEAPRTPVGKHAALRCEELIGYAAAPRGEPAPETEPRRIQTACDRCTRGVMDADNPHLHGLCTCACHRAAAEPRAKGET